MFPEQSVVGESLIHQAARNRKAEVLVKCGMSRVLIRYMNYFNTMVVMRVEAQS